MTPIPALPRLQTRYVILALGWVLGVWGLADLSGRLAQRRQEVKTAQLQVQKYHAIVALKPRIASAYQAYASAFEPGSTRIGPQAFLEELEGCADGSMQLNLKPQALRNQAKDADAKHLGVEVELEATQQGVMAFLDRLFALPSLVELERFHIAASASAEHPLKASLLVSKHEL